jgi:hypothetical protein
MCAKLNPQNRAYPPVRALPGQLERMFAEWQAEGAHMFGGEFIPSRAVIQLGSMRAIARALIDMPIAQASAALRTPRRTWRDTLHSVDLYEEHKRRIEALRRGG